MIIKQKTNQNVTGYKKISAHQGKHTLTTTTALSANRDIRHKTEATDLATKTDFGFYVRCAKRVCNEGVFKICSSLCV